MQGMSEHDRHIHECRMIMGKLAVPFVSRDVKVLYVRSGSEYMAAYQLISTGITDCLGKLVKEAIAVNPSESVKDLALRTRPDLVLVLLGDRFEGKVVEAIRESGIKTAVWLTDDPYYTDETVKYASHYDFVFTNESSTVSLYRNLGCRSVHYLPMAANSSVFYPRRVDGKYLSDICFIATAWNNRIAFIDRIAMFLKNKNVKIIGPLWDQLKNYSILSDKIYPTGISAEETAKYFCGAKIVINLHRSHDDQTLFSKNSRNLEAYSLNPRTFEISACGSFQLTDVREDLESLYTPGRDIETFSSTQEFVGKINYYLRNERKRREIALQGLKTALQEHTYHYRLMKLLNIVFNK